jgi:peptidoglycan/xylan/chitin deacetylase (PgdA/CDA1 family)
MSRIAILGYHKVGPPAPGGWETWFQIPERVFAQHLAILREGGWELLDAGTFLDGLANPDRLPQRGALITFDDGYRSLRDAALRCLRASRAPAVLFMPSDFVGRDNEFDQGGSEPEEPLCDWRDLKELARCGVSIQSHGASHRGFSEISPAGRRDELERSKAELEAGVGQPVELFAFPYGDDAEGGAEVGTALADAGYRAACGYGGRPFSIPAADPYRLPRVAMGPDTDLRAVLTGAAGADGS